MHTFVHALGEKAQKVKQAYFHTAPSLPGGERTPGTGCGWTFRDGELVFGRTLLVNRYLTFRGPKVHKTTWVGRGESWWSLNGQSLCTLEYIITDTSSLFQYTRYFLSIKGPGRHEFVEAIHHIRRSR